MALSNAECKKRHREKYKKLGLCTNCGKPRDGRSTVLCDTCLEKSLQIDRDNRQWARENHFCTVCMKNKVYGSDKTCFECRAHKIEIAKKSRTPEKNKIYVERYKEYSRNLYQERKEQGICTRCGKLKALPNRAKCYKCLESQRIQNQKRYVPKGNTFQNRLDAGLCFRCGKVPALPNYKICESCKTELASYSKKCNWHKTNEALFLKRMESVNNMSNEEVVTNN